MEILLGKTLQELQEVAQQVGLPRFAGKQLAEWIYQKRATTFDEMTNISLRGREKLAAQYQIGRVKPAAEAISEDGTKKYLFPVLGNQYIESVYIPEADRATLCVSTQAGCKMGCKFCMTGTLGFHGQLTAGDILNQVFSIPDSLRLTNLVYMGEGEPCDNIDNVLRSVECLTAPWGCQFSPHRITISSVGYLKGLQRLLDETDCHVAISLHNPYSNEREQIMPVERTNKLFDVIKLLHGYDWTHQRRISFEYICFGGQNDDYMHAKQLRNLLSDLNCRVNLIRFHEGVENEGMQLPVSDEKQMIWLRDYLTEKGITTTIRRSRGEDIKAACGMLVASNKSK